MNGLMPLLLGQEARFDRDGNSFATLQRFSNIDTTQAMFDMSAQPEYIKTLKAKAVSVLKPEGG